MGALVLFLVTWVVINEETIFKVKFNVFSFTLSVCLFCEPVEEIALRSHLYLFLLPLQGG